MNKNLTKIAALSVSLAMAIGVGVALGSKAVRNVRATDGSVTINNTTSNTDGVLTVAIAKASGSNAPITGDYGVRLYAKNTVTITSSSTITALTIPWTKNPNKAFASVSADVGTYTHPSAAGNGTWSGSATSIVLTVGDSGQIQFNSVSYTVSGSSGPAVSLVTVSPTTMTLNLQGTTSGTITPTVNASGGADETVTWSVLNDDPTDCVSVSDAGVVTAEAEGTATVRATSTFDDTKYADCAVTVLDEPVVTFELVTSATDLEAGSTYAITNGKEDGSAYAMSNAEQLKYRQYTSVTVSDNTFEAPQNLLRLTLSGSTDEWVFTTENYEGTDGVLYPSSASDKNELYVGESDSTATISFSDDAAIITLSGNSDGRGIISWNNNAGQERFSCYKSGQQPVYLWKEVSHGPQLPSMYIGLYPGHTADTYEPTYNSTVGAFTMYVYDEDDNKITAPATFTSSNENVYKFEQAVGSSGYTFTTTGAGTCTLTASVEGYKNATKTISVNVGNLQSLSVSGSMTKTDYSTTDTAWDPTGLVVTGSYSTGYVGDVTSQVTWSFDPAVPASGVTSVVATATLDVQTADSDAQAVTVTAPSGTFDNPYTVAQARAAIDASSGTSGVYATGIVSEIVTAYSSQYSNITFNITADGNVSTTMIQAFRCKGSTAHPIASDDDVEVGATVIIKGNLKKYNGAYEFDAGCTVESYTAPTGTKYSVVSRIENGSLSVDEVLEGSTLNVNVVPDMGYFYPDSLTLVRMAGVDVDYTYVDGVVTVENVTGNVVIEGVCTSCCRIQSLYGQVNNTAVEDFYGYYVGMMSGSGPIIMDGEYGMLLFNSSQDVSEWTENETIIHVTAGTLSIYNGLYEVKNYTCEVAESADISAPITHISTGSETKLEANRLTNATGYVDEVTGGDLEGDPEAADIKFNFVIGGSTLQIFYKKAAQNADDMATLKDSLDNSTEITLKGFSSWYNGFQIQMSGLVEPQEDYTAEDFAEDLLAQTDAVCVAYLPDESQYASIRAALVTIWADLASVDKYGSLPQEEKELLALDDLPEGTIIADAMERYDFLTAKYNLSNFINGRTPVSVHIANYELTNQNSNSNTMIIVISVIAAVSALSIGVLLVIKKRKHN